MMELDEFAKSHNVEIAEQRINENDINMVEKNIRKFLISVLGDILTTEEIVRKEKELQTFFGPELRKYILNFGYLKYGEVSFYGIGNGDPLSSNLVIQTKYFNKNYPATWGN